MRISIAIMMAAFAVRCSPSAQDAPAPVRTNSPQASGRQVVVYYLHRTFRCASCNRMEQMTHDALKKAFAGELASGSMRWQTADFQQQEQLGQRYEATFPSVVVVSTLDGRDTGHRRMDVMWSLRDDPAAFRATLTEAVKAAMNPQGSGT